MNRQSQLLYTFRPRGSRLPLLINGDRHYVGDKSMYALAVVEGFDVVKILVLVARLESWRSLTVSFEAEGRSFLWVLRISPNHWTKNRQS